MLPICTFRFRSRNVHSEVFTLITEYVEIKTMYSPDIELLLILLLINFNNINIVFYYFSWK